MPRRRGGARVNGDRPLTPFEEQLLIAVLAGERSRDDAEVKAAMKAARFAAELAALEGVQRRLDAAGLEQSTDLRGADPALEAVAERSVRASMAASPKSGKVVSFRRWATLAAAVIAAVVLWRLQESPKSSPLLGGTMRIEVSDGPRFTFSFSLPPGGHYQIQVETTAGRIESHRVEWPASSWTPERAIVDRWGDGAEVSAKALDRDGAELAAGSGARWVRGR